MKEKCQVSPDVVIMRLIVGTSCGFSLIAYIVSLPFQPKTLSAVYFHFALQACRGLSGGGKGYSGIVNPILCEIAGCSAGVFPFWRREHCGSDWPFQALIVSFILHVYYCFLILEVFGEWRLCSNKKWPIILNVDGGCFNFFKYYLRSFFDIILNSVVDFVHELHHFFLISFLLSFWKTHASFFTLLSKWVISPSSVLFVIFTTTANSTFIMPSHRISFFTTATNLFSFFLQNLKYLYFLFLGHPFSKHAAKFWSCLPKIDSCWIKTAGEVLFIFKGQGAVNHIQNIALKAFSSHSILIVLHFHISNCVCPLSKSDLSSVGVFVLPSVTLFCIPISTGFRFC